MIATADDIITFWRESGPDAWFTKDDAFDATIRERFEATWHAARRGELDDWAETPQGLLALVLVLDQFSRNLARDSAAAYESDDEGVRLACQALERGWIDDLMRDEATRPVAVFALMPFMHSESIVDQNAGVAAMLRPEWANNFDFAVVHRDIIARFGRFAHRNPVLGRRTTPAERDYLESGGFGG